MYQGILHSLHLTIDPSRSHVTMAHTLPSLRTPGPIKFGTDGWRGIIGEDFTFERLYRAACAAAQVLAETYGPTTQSKRVIIGYDRRFLSEEFAQVCAIAVQAVGLEPLLSSSYAPTPAFSLAAKDQGALGALVITASHNPGTYSGLKLKGAFGGSVPGEVTQRVEAVLGAGQFPAPPESAVPPNFPRFDPWPRYCEVLRAKVDVAAIQAMVNPGQLKVYVDVMHGAAATGLARVLDIPVTELHSDRDPLFGGGAPEPLPRYLGELMAQLSQRSNPETLAVGLVFDGDADRIAAVDGQGRFLSSQVLIPILIEHLSQRRGLGGEVIKTVSGSDLMPKTAELFGLSVYETAVGYKYIADRMLSTPVLIGGEESGGIGYGSHIPERDALLAALYLLEAIAQSGQGLESLYHSLQERTDCFTHYDRIDLPLASMAVRDRVVAALKTEPPTAIAHQPVIDTLTIDGYKFRLADQRWLMVRFSGTEPLLRLYCEAASPEAVQETLLWAKDWASQF